MRLVDLVWRSFCSLKLTATLIGMLMIGSFAGMFIDQTQSFEAHMAAIAGEPLKQRLFTALELYNLFGSWWFMGLVLLLALNLIACTLERIPRVWREVMHGDKELSEERLRALSNGAELKASSFDNAVAEARKVLAGKGRGVLSFKREDGLLLFVERQRIARFSAILIHLSLLIIIFGHVGNSMWGQDGSISIPEGMATSTYFVRGPAGLSKRSKLDFQIRCDDFRAETFKSGRPMDFESDLVVFEDGKERLRKTIRVNDPLDWGELTFYQSSYAPLAGEERILMLGGPRGGELKPLELRIGQRATLTSGVSVTPVEVIENLGGYGEAVRVLRTTPSGEQQTLQLVTRFPELDANMRKGEDEFRISSVERRYRTILSVASSPLASVVFIGFTLMLVGAGFATVLSHRRYWVLVKQTKKGSSLYVTGAARRHRPAFAKEHGSMVQDLKARLGLTDDKRGKKGKK